MDELYPIVQDPVLMNSPGWVIRDCQWFNQLVMPATCFLKRTIQRKAEERSFMVVRRYIACQAKTIFNKRYVSSFKCPPVFTYSFAQFSRKIPVPFKTI